jgi:hypothetical protein
VPKNVYPVPEQPIIPLTYIPNYIGNQFPIVDQLMTSKKKQHVTALLPTIVQITTSLPTYVPKGFDHQPPDGKQLGDSPRGCLPRGDQLGKPPFNPPIASFGWLAPNPRMLW